VLFLGYTLKLIGISHHGNCLTVKEQKKGKERQNRLDSRLGPLGNNLNFNACVS